MGKLIDLTGQRFGRLTVIERAGSDKHKRAMWKCQCDCGKCFITYSGNLRTGSVKSCGCLRIDTIVAYSTKHGKRHSRLYGVWQNMKKRCYDPRVHNYPNYGGRGITMCAEWRDDFGKFYEWAVAHGYDKNAPYMQCTIDRIDNDRGYSPDNCRWADAKTQARNQRRWKVKENEGN